MGNDPQHGLDFANPYEQKAKAFCGDCYFLKKTTLKDRSIWVHFLEGFSQKVASEQGDYDYSRIYDQQYDAKLAE